MIEPTKTLISFAVDGIPAAVPFRGETPVDAVEELGEREVRILRYDDPGADHKGVVLLETPLPQGGS